jgi:hypothetical protein
VGTQPAGGCDIKKNILTTNITERFKFNPQCLFSKAWLRAPPFKNFVNLVALKLVMGRNSLSLTFSGKQSLRGIIIGT